MFAKSDREFLNNKIYSMALEKFFSEELNSHYYSRQNDINRIEKNIHINFAVEKVYPFSNEDLDALFKELKVQGKTVATAGSSGDQMLAALLCGAKKVTLIDGNLYSKHFIDYKFASIKNLPYEEFKHYFIDTHNYFDLKIFENVFHDLDTDSQTFWGTILTHTNTPSIIKNRIITQNAQRPQTNYLYNEQNYKKLQSILNSRDFDIEFQIAEFNDFPEVLTGQYDAILLSNIFQYVNNDDYISVVLSLQDKLKPNGKIQLNYDFPNAFGKTRPNSIQSFKDSFETGKNKVYSIDCLPDRLYFLSNPAEPEKEFI